MQIVKSLFLLIVLLGTSIFAMELPTKDKPTIPVSSQHPLIDAIRANQIDRARELIEGGANVNEQDKNGTTPLLALAAADLEKSLAMFDLVGLLLARGASVQHRNNGGYSALDYAIMNNNYKIVKALLATGIDPNEKNPAGITPLHLLIKHYGNAIRGNRIKLQPETLATTKALFAAGADPRIGNERGHDAILAAGLSSLEGTDYFIYIASLHQAAAQGDDALVSWLIDNQPKDFLPKYINAILGGQYWKNLDETVNEKQTALHKAVASGSFATTKLLLEAWANPNAQDDNGDTPLHYASRNGDEKLVELLLSYKADPNLANKEGKTASEVAKERLTLAQVQPLNLEQSKSLAAIIPMMELAKTGAFPLPATQVDKPVGGTPKGSMREEFQPGAEPLEAIVGGAVVQGARLQQAPTLRRNLIIAMISAVAGGGLLYTYFTGQIPINLYKDELNKQLITALASRQFEYAYQLALKNPQAVQALRADTSAQHGIVQLIEQRELDLINETVVESFYQRLTRPSTSIQLQHLANLARLIDVR